MSPLLGVGAGLASSFLASALAGSALAASAAGFSGALSLSWAPAPLAAANSASMEKRAISFFIVFSLDCSGVGFAGAYAHDLFQVENENLAIADLAGIGGFLDRLEHALEHVGVDRRFDLHLRQEVHHVFGAAVELGVPFLPAAALYLGDGDALNADSREGFAHLVELEGLDDCSYQFHVFPLLRPPAATPAPRCRVRKSFRPEIPPGLCRRPS